MARLTRRTSLYVVVVVVLLLRDSVNTDSLEQVIKACQSLNSRGYVKTRFSWQYYYYTLTPEVGVARSAAFFFFGIQAKTCIGP